MHTTIPTIPAAIRIIILPGWGYGFNGVGAITNCLPPSGKSAIPAATTAKLYPDILNTASPPGPMTARG